MADETDPRFSFVPICAATEPRSGRAYADYWWAVHPTRGLIVCDYAPQCNADRRVGEHVAAGLYPWAEIRQIPLVFTPRDGWGAR